jgi:N-acetylglucosaminyl-diphospho-decaprenol L-rhamnosyltransferase
VSAQPLPLYLIHRNQPELCARSIAAFAAQSHPVGVHVVDNGSSPDALARLRVLAPSVDIIETGTNLGFGPGANVAFRRWLGGGTSGDGPGDGTGDGTGDWVAIAPHDALPEPGCVERLMSSAAQHPRAGLVCAEFGAGFDMVPAIDKVIGGFYRPAERGVGWQDVEYPHGTLLLARRQTLEAVGLFDERYFAYCEEVDLALRVRRDGWDIGMVWGAVVANGHLPSRPVADYLQVRNTLLLIHDFYGSYFVGWRCALAAWQIGRKVLREPRHAMTHLCLEGRAMADFFRRRFGPPPAAVLAIDRRSWA